MSSVCNPKVLESMRLGRFNPRDLHPGDTIDMAPYHNIYGCKGRGWMYVGVAVSKHDRKTYPLFCALQSSHGKGPIPHPLNPMTWFRNPVSVYRRPEHNKFEFWNLSELVVLYPPENGLIYASIWNLQPGEEHWNRFLHGIFHLESDHPRLFAKLCEFNATESMGSSYSTAKEVKKTGLKIMKLSMNEENCTKGKSCCLNKGIREKLGGRKWPKTWRILPGGNQHGLTSEQCKAMYGRSEFYTQSKYELHLESTWKGPSHIVHPGAVLVTPPPSDVSASGRE